MNKLRYKNKLFYKIYSWYFDKIKHRKKITYWDWKKENENKSDKIKKVK